MSYTKGKWVDNFFPNHDGYRHSIAVKGGPIIAYLPDCNRDRAEQVDANARLISLAPEMAEWIRIVLLAHETHNCGVTNGEARLCEFYAMQARALLAKIDKGIV